MRRGEVGGGSRREIGLIRRKDGGRKKGGWTYGRFRRWLSCTLLTIAVRRGFRLMWRWEKGARV